MADIVNLVKALAWPLVALTALIRLLPEIRGLVAILSQKIERSKTVKIAKIIELAEEVARGAAVPKMGQDDKIIGNKVDEFEKLAKAYDELHIADYNQRVSERERLVARLTAIAIDLDLKRGALAEQKSEGKLVTLASLILNRPLPNDINYLEKASQTASFRFTRYRIVLATLPTLSRPVLTTKTINRVEFVLNNVENKPEAPDEILQRLIDKFRQQLEIIREQLA